MQRENLFCAQHEGKSIDFLITDESSSQVFACKDCCVGIAPTKLVSMIEIQLKDPKKFLTNWPPLIDPTLPQRMNEIAAESLVFSSKFFNDLRVEIGRRIDGLEEKTKEFLKLQKSNFDGTYAMIARKNKLKELAVDKLNVTELQAFIHKANGNAGSNSELLDALFDALSYSSNLKPITELSEKVFKEIEDFDINKLGACSIDMGYTKTELKEIAVIESDRKEEKKLYEKTQKFIEDCNQKLAECKFENFNQEWKDHTSIFASMKISNNEKHMPFTSEKIIFAQGELEEIWKLEPEKRLKKITQDKDKFTGGWWSEIWMMENKKSKDKSFLCEKAGKSLNTFGELTQATRSKDIVKFNKAEELYQFIQEQKKEINALEDIIQKKIASGQE